ncbi:MAG: alanine racemase [Candidatus Omnitrophica bacterium]|nr:alanine racemase [Candidatus Omnitrophota bacterium]
MKFYRPTFAEIDLGAIRYNLRKIKQIIRKDTKVMGVVKADAYGHGMREVSKAIVKEGVDYLGVASLDEAKELREGGIESKIIVLGTILPEEIEGVLRYNVIQTVSDLNIARRLSELGQARNKLIKAHIKIDTGMGRIGFWHEEAVGFVKRINGLKNIVIEGIFTHFPSAEENSSFTHRQLKDFRTLIEKLRSCNIDIPLKHISNSIALVDFEDSHMNMVRPGLIMYGLYPRGGLRSELGLKPALKLKTKAVYVKPIAKGRSISYGRTFITEKDTKIATIPVGYGDGYSRYLSNRAHVLIKGKRAPIVGKVCMDMSMVDVGHIKNVRSGDDVVLIGTQGKEIITVEELAKLTNTIPYEVVCNIGRRVPRVYIK